jgi:hypothetical protein
LITNDIYEKGKVKKSPIINQLWFNPSNLCPLLIPNSAS